MRLRQRCTGYRVEQPAVSVLIATGSLPDTLSFAVHRRVLGNAGENYVGSLRKSS
jgi:hypothetical protein